MLEVVKLADVTQEEYDEDWFIDDELLPKNKKEEHEEDEEEF